MKKMNSKEGNELNTLRNAPFSTNPPFLFSFILPVLPLLYLVAVAILDLYMLYLAWYLYYSGEVNNSKAIYQ